MRTRNQAFSLIELMVVVAIIGILATLAVPNYQKFSARARQASAKSELSGIFTAEKSFVGQYNTYATYLKEIGFVPDDSQVTLGSSRTTPLRTRYYVTGIVSNNAALTPPCVALWPPDLQMPTTRTPTVYNSSYDDKDFDVWEPYVMGGTFTGIQLCSVNTFMGTSVGDIQRKGNYDIWTINQDRALQNRQSGL